MAYYMSVLDRTGSTRKKENEKQHHKYIFNIPKLNYVCTDSGWKTNTQSQSQPQTTLCISMCTLYVIINFFYVPEGGECHAALLIPIADAFGGKAMGPRNNKATSKCDQHPTPPFDCLSIGYVKIRCRSIPTAMHLLAKRPLFCRKSCFISFKQTLHDPDCSGLDWVRASPWAASRSTTSSGMGCRQAPSNPRCLSIRRGPGPYTLGAGTLCRDPASGGGAWLPTPLVVPQRVQIACRRLWKNLTDA